ncbi:MAG: 2-aminoethylphosphonate--pyruvate transaminase [Lachnospiraceae bacterium]
MEQKILLTAGPICTSMRVKEAMLRDLGTRDHEYQDMVEQLRNELLQLAHVDADTHSVVFLQGSGTYGVESVLDSSVGKKGKVLILSNGAYGERMEQICIAHGISYQMQSFSKLEALPVEKLESYIKEDSITHVAFIHCETTAGVLNDLEAILKLTHKYHKRSIVDAMSSFGSMEMNLKELDMDFLITSSNKCLHGVPGVAIIYGKQEAFQQCEGNADNLAMDLYKQWAEMEASRGAFRFTSPTHVLLALNEAVKELKEQGGIAVRHDHYVFLQKKIQDTMKELGFEAPVKREEQAPVITTYFIPEWMDFSHFYDWMKERDILLYSGKLPGYHAFRIGNLGDLSVSDIERTLDEIRVYVREYGPKSGKPSMVEE